MKVFCALLRNHLARTVQRAASLFTLTAVVLGSMLFSLYASRAQQVIARIAYVQPADYTVEALVSSPELKVTQCVQSPPLSDLLQQKYDAVVTRDNLGNYSIQTLRNADFQTKLFTFLNHPDADLSSYRQDRGVGVNLIGFMMMFMLMLAFANLYPFANDKEQGQLLRIAASPASMGTYLAAQYCYCLIMTVPEFLLLAVLRLCGVSIGFTLVQFIWLLLMLDSLGVAFALLINTLIHKPDNANMLGNSIAVLTSVLAGSFYSFSKNNAVLDLLVRGLPQKQLLNYAEALQNGTASTHWGSLAYVVFLTAVFFTLGWFFLQRKVHLKG